MIAVNKINCNYWRMSRIGEMDKALPMNRKIKQTTRGIMRRKEIVQATKILLLKENIENIGVKDIAKGANIPISSIYNLFEDIDDIYRAVIEDIWSEFTKYREDKLRESYASFEELIEHSTRINFYHVMSNELIRKTIYSKHVNQSIKETDKAFLLREIKNFVSRYLPNLTEPQFIRTVELIRKQTLIFDVLIADILDDANNLKEDDLNDVLDIILKISD